MCQVATCSLVYMYSAGTGALIASAPGWQEKAGVVDIQGRMSDYFQCLGGLDTKLSCHRLFDRVAIYVVNRDSYYNITK